MWSQVSFPVFPVAIGEAGVLVDEESLLPLKGRISLIAVDLR